MPPPRDITEEFTAAASALPLGELVKDDFFTLAESVGALEIMDPKMDSGFLEPGESLEPDYNLAQDLSAEQVLGLMDRLLCSEAAWHEGNPLAQTIFTCLYIDSLLWPDPKDLDSAVFKYGNSNTQPGQLIDLVLRAYCCGLVRTCDFVHARVTKEQYYEDEDISAHLYNRWLLSSVPVEEVMELLVKAKAYVENAADISEPLRVAIKDRLQFRSYLLEALSSNPIESSHLLCLSLQKCLELLPAMKNSSRLGMPVTEAFSPKVQRKLVSSTPPRPIVELGIDDTFKRFSRLCEDAQEATKVLRCETPGDVVNFIIGFMSRRDGQPSVLIRCLMQSLIFNEGIFLGRYGSNEFVFTDLSRLVIGDSILINPANEVAEAPQSRQFRIWQQMQNFGAAMSSGLMDLARCLCMNRSRARRLLARSLSEWENLQFEAEDADIRLQQLSGELPLIDRLSPSREKLWSYPLSSYAYAYKLRQMQWTVQMGFELGIYLPDELSSMFWYLRYLAEVRAHHLGRVSTFTRRSSEMLPPRRATGAQSRDSSKTNDNGLSLAHAKFDVTLDTLDFGVAEATATQSLADALAHLYCALVVAGLISVPPRPYSDAALRHALRMKPFLPVSLPPVPLVDDLETAIETRLKLLSTQEADNETGNEDNEGTARSRRHHKVLALLDFADQSARAARREWEAVSKAEPEIAQCVGSEETWRRKTRDVLKCAIATGITIVGMRKGLIRLQEENKKKKAENNSTEGVTVAGNNGTQTKDTRETRDTRDTKKTEEARVVKELKDLMEVSIPSAEKGEGYHEWWPVPSVKMK